MTPPNDAPTTLREIVATAIKKASHDPWSKGGIADDTWPYMADAAIAAVRVHLLSDDVIDRSLARIPATSPMEMGALYRAAIGAALGDT